MKKKLLITFLLILPIIASSQRQKFAPKVEVISTKTLIDSVSYKSILFVYSGNAHLVYHYKDLSKRLKKQFKRSKIKVGFAYHLDTIKASSADLKNIPKNELKEEDFDLICQISVQDMETWDNHLLKRRKQKYTLNVKAFYEGEIYKQIEILVQTFFTISTQNNSISKLIRNSF